MKTLNKASNPMAEQGTLGSRNDVPKHLLLLFQKAAKGKSRASAIKCFCLTCVGFVKADVKNCVGTSCPLWIYRPYQTGVVDEKGIENE